MKNKFFLLVSISFLLVSFSVFHTAQAATPAKFLGKIFLQVETHGEAWYINPVNGGRYFLGRPADAFTVMRSLGMGVSNKTFTSWQGRAPVRLAGRIVLKVEDSGKAYYINPKNLEILYLGRPADAFAVMRQVGTGITNATLSSIPAELNLPIAKSESPAPTVANQNTGTHYLTWIYKKKTYSIDLNLDANLYQSYTTSPKDYSYSKTLPANWRQSYYQTFLTPKTNDSSISSLTGQFKVLAKNNNLSNDQLIELVVAFVQAIPYDSARVSSKVKPNYPYETLYKKLGVCSDKTFLGVLLLRDLGYGAAVLDYPNKNHAALGVACPSQYSINNSGYCFAETTNFFPIGFVPQNLSASGVAVKQESKTIVGQFNNVFNIGSLGQVEIYQQTTGQIYQGIVATYQLVDKLKILEASIISNQQIIDNLKIQLDAKSVEVETSKQRLQTLQTQGNIEGYNQLIPAYNQLVNEHNEIASNYKLKIEIYNNQSNSYNQGVNDIYYAGN